MSNGEAAVAVANTFYHEWGFLGIVLLALGLAVPALWKVLTTRHDEPDKAELVLQQSASALFVQVILSESRRVFSIADDHLPLALTQSRSEEPAPSRFDLFCRALRDIPEEELDDRGRYADIIRESFGRIISECTHRLIDAMSAAGASSPNPWLNPTGVRFSLEADGYLQFSEISRLDSKNRLIYSVFRSLWTAAGITLGLSAISLCPGVLVVLLESGWAESLGIASLWIGISTFLLAVLLLLVSFLVRSRLIARARKFGDPGSLEEHVRQKVSAKAGGSL